MVKGPGRRVGSPIEKPPMTILLVNAGSSSLKCTLMGPDRKVLAGGAADWSGNAASYEYTGPDELKQTETVAWRTYGDAFKQFLGDATESKPAVLKDKHELAGVGHRIVHGGRFTSSVF